MNGSRLRRRQRGVRFKLEALEGRVVLNASPLDTSFGMGGVAVGPIASQSGITASTDYSVIALQSDGKIVQSELAYFSDGTSTLVVRRFTSAGAVDTTFGSNGQTTIPLSAFEAKLPTFGAKVYVGSDDRIIVGVSTLDQFDPYSTSTPTPDFVARLTASGQLDTSFGSNGEAVLPTSFKLSSSVVRADGGIVVAGSQDIKAAGDSVTHSQPVLIQLTTAGQLDTSFNGTGQLAFDLPNSQSASGSGYKELTVIDLVATSSGQLTLGTTLHEPGLIGYPPNLTQIKPDGTLDSSFGTGGTKALALATLYDLAIQPDGKLLLATRASEGGPNGSNSVATVVRLNADGSTDSTFRTIQANPSAGMVSQFFSINGVTVEADGKLIMAGYSKSSAIFLVGRWLANGTLDTSFGTNGITPINAPPGGLATAANGSALKLSSDVAVADGKVLVSGERNNNQALVVRLSGASTRSVSNDFDSDGKSDISAYLPDLGVYASRPSGGGSDVLTAFGQPGAGKSIPSSGDFDGDGVTDLSVYLATFGQIAYRPSSGGSDVRVPVLAGTPTAAPGDYDGDGITDVAAFYGGIFEISYSTTGRVDVPLFGNGGTNGSIPAPGDYDGDGKTDLAVYLPNLGALAYRPSSGGKDQVIPFGQVGVGASIPTPGDYDGDGKTDLSVYLPSLAIYAYRPSSGGPDILQTFGQVGDGASIPTPGDYDGDGKTDLSVYLPSLAQFAYRPSLGGADKIEVFGTVGTGKTIPTASIPYAQPRSNGTTSAFRVGVVTPAPPVFIPLTNDLTSPSPKKKTTGTA